LMYTNLHAHGVGGFDDVEYWSSSEYTSADGYYVIMDDGTSGHTKKEIVYKVRPIRTFTLTEATPSYAVRDVGQSGGLIFRANNNGDGTYTYLEAAAADLAGRHAWSNIEDVEIGTTGTAIGTGLANTNAIIGQAGHTASAAKSAKDYTVTSRAMVCAYDNDYDNV